MYRLSLILLLIQLSVLGMYAQNQAASGIIRAKLVDEKNESLVASSVFLHRTKDSSLVKSVIVNDQGEFEFEFIKQGEYFLRVTELGKIPYSSAPILITTDQPIVELPVIRLELNTAINLSEVTIKAEKPFIERQLDKMVVNVDNLISAAGSSAFEVLELSPGVVIDQNDNISLKGKQGVLVMINGKLSGISGRDLANYLRGLPANTIQKIELITNPSARYDAAGNAGIINIVMKKDQRTGTNGSLNLSYGQGKYAKTGQGITLNHRNKKINVFGSYNFAYRKAFSHLTLYRKFLEQGELDGVYDQDNNITFPFKNYIGRTGIDYTLNSKTTIGAVISGVSNRFITSGDTHTDVLDKNEIKNSYHVNTNRSTDQWFNYAANANLKHTFDSTGKEITIDLDYAQYGNNTDQHFRTEFFNLDGSVDLPTYILLGDVRGRLSIKSAKADYTHPLKNKAKMEAGWKSSLVTADNDLKYFDGSSGSAVLDPNQSNHFLYRENINAVYLNYSNSFKKINFQMGFRAEQTDTEGNQLTTQQKFDSSYINLFPSAVINFKASEKHEWSLSVSRRLDRPSYRQLNPFKFFINNSTYSEGNPYLRPQYTYVYELGHTYNQKISATLAYSLTKENITEVIFPAPDLEKITIQTNRNLAQFEFWGLNISAPFPLAKWWNSVNNINIYYGIYTGSLANTNLNNGKLNFNLSSNNSITINDNGWSAEINGVYRAPENYGFMQVRSNGGLSAGVQKTILNNKGTLRLNVSDIFYTQGARAVTTFRDYEETFEVLRETRVATLAFSYRFGNTKVPGARRRSGGAEEEKQRAGNG